MTADLQLWPIGNCQVSALLNAAGSIVWSCVPRVDGDPAFCALLDTAEDGNPPRGIWSAELVDQVEARSRYLRNTPVLSTVLTDAQGGSVEMLSFCPRFERSGRMYRPVAYGRIIRPLAGSPRLRMRLAPTKNWGDPDVARTNGTNHARYLCDAHTLRLSTDAPVGHILEERAFRVERAHHFFLGPDEPFVGNIGREVSRMCDLTIDYWRYWVRSLATPFEWQDAVIRAAITLKLCQHEETGAIVAALTTSIPEAPHSERNWDYRYCWIRDAYYTVQALNRLGALDVLEKYLSYLRNIVDEMQEGAIQPLFAVSGESELPEAEAEKLPGYRGMGPVRIGNAAALQTQHDVYGQIILPTIQSFCDQRLFRMSERADFERLESVGELAWKMHDQPDAGLWEFRTRSAVHTYSAVMSWAACDRLAKAAAMVGLADRAKFWSDRAEKVRETIEAEAWHKDSGRFGASFGRDDVDASLLQLVDMRFLAPDDPRFIATFEAIEERLRRGEHMLRYDSEDDFGLPETAFNICTFWLIEALFLVGRKDEARALFEQMLARRTESGLLSEDMDFETGELWGNFPQTYSLVGIINCAGLLSVPWSQMR